MSGLVDLMDAAIAQIREVIEPLLTAEGLESQYESGTLNAPSTTPAIDIRPGARRDSEARMFASEYDGGGYLFTVRARFSTNDFDANKRLMYRMMDDYDELSLANALGQDWTLDGLAADADATDPSGEVVYEGGYYGFQFTLRVLPAFS